MALSEVAANVYFVFAGCGRYLDGPIERARLVYRALWFLPVVSQNVVDSGVDRYLILVGSGSGSVRIPSQILYQLKKLRSLADEKSVARERVECAHGRVRGLGRANDRADWEAAV